MVRRNYFSSMHDGTLLDEGAVLICCDIMALMCTVDSLITHAPKNQLTELSSAEPGLILSWPVVSVTSESTCPISSNSRRQTSPNGYGL